MMKILLVYPKFPDTFWGFKHALKFVFKRAVTPPLGLLTVASLLPSTWEKRLVDMNVRELSQRDIRWADLVFISAIRLQLDSTRSILKQCRRLGKTIVAGGPLFTTEYNEFPEVDHFVLNEAELTLSHFVADLENRVLKRMYASDQWSDLSQTPPPMWSLVHPEDYYMLNIQYSRGCPYECEFCDISQLFGRRQRVKTTTQILNELDLIYQLGWRDQILFVDDNFIGNKQLLKQELLPALIAWMQERKYPFSFYTQASINLADDEDLMRSMVAAGFTTVFIGIETTHQPSLDECRKHLNLNKDLTACVKKCHAFGLQVQGGFIVGFDHDPPTVFDDQIEFIQKSGIVTAMIGLLNPMIGTRLYTRLQQAGRLINSFEGDNMDGKLQFVPVMDPQRLLVGYQKILRTLYSPENYYSRIKQFLKDYKAVTPVRYPIHWRTFLIFLKTTFYLGVLGLERKYYWDLIQWTLTQCPENLRLAMTLAVFGLHHRVLYCKGKSEEK